VIQNMLPQVINQVQVVFESNSAQEEVFAICVVNNWCRFTHYSRERFPKITPESLDKAGYYQPLKTSWIAAERIPLTGQAKDAALKKLSTKAWHASTIQMYKKSGPTTISYHPSFIRYWENLLTWTSTMVF